MKQVRIIIADDHRIFINGLQMLLEGEPNFQVQDIANDGKELLDILHENLPDVVLLDINMPGMNGLDAAVYLRRNHPSLKIIILSTYHEDHLIEKAKKNGVNGYLLKNCDKQELLDTIQLVMSGQTSFPYRAPALSTGMKENDMFLKKFNLTAREKEIISKLKEGHTNKQIADQLFLSVFTVETHRKNLMRKLGLNSPAALMKFIMEQGF